MSGLTMRIPPAVARKLGHYVYLYVNPVDKSVFYVGKGLNGRALSHLRPGAKKKVTKTIQKIRASGYEPSIEILAHNLGSERVALKVEAAVIDLLGIDSLANVIKGHGVDYGRLPLRELIARYTGRRVRITEPAILIRINKLYRYGTTDAELYDATRSAWKVGKRRADAQLAFCVFESVVREVYSITAWHPAGTTFRSRSDRRGLKKGRWEFVGTIADKKYRRRYINTYVGDLLRPGARNPISYVDPKRVGRRNGGKSARNAVRRAK